MCGARGAVLPPTDVAALAQINWFKAGSALNYMKEHPQ